MYVPRTVDTLRKRSYGLQQLTLAPHVFTTGEISAACVDYICAAPTANSPWARSATQPPELLQVGLDGHIDQGAFTGEKEISGVLLVKCIRLRFRADSGISVYIDLKYSCCTQVGTVLPYNIVWSPGVVGAPKNNDNLSCAAFGAECLWLPRTVIDKPARIHMTYETLMLGVSVENGRVGYNV